MEERIICALNKTWSAIAYDVLSEAGTMKRREVCEVVLDADAVETYGGDKDAAAALRQMSFKQQDAIAMKAFPHKTYGI